MPQQPSGSQVYIILGAIILLGAVAGYIVSGMVSRGVAIPEYVIQKPDTLKELDGPGFQFSLLRGNETYTSLQSFGESTVTIPAGGRLNMFAPVQ
ncbi:MAG: hypothetical protein AAB463_02915 [Patescibacteria group bacterium]